MSGTITSTDESGVQPRVQRLRYRAMIQRPGATQYIVKIYSKAKITDSNLETSFGRGKIGWAHRQAIVVGRISLLPVGQQFPSGQDRPTNVPVSVMEGLWSKMETEIASSQNEVNFLAGEKLGYGIRDPASPKGSAPDSYVLGWD